MHTQKAVSAADILSKRTICPPITIAMSAPTGDGGAAAILCSQRFMEEHNLQVRTYVRQLHCVRPSIVYWVEYPRALYTVY